MNEVYVIAGGEWLRNNLNAIAAFTSTRTWDSIEKIALTLSVLDLFRGFWVIFQPGSRIRFTLTDLLTFVAVPRACFLDKLLFHAQVNQLAVAIALSSTIPQHAGRCAWRRGNVQLLLLPKS